MIDADGPQNTGGGTLNKEGERGKESEKKVVEKRNERRDGGSKEGRKERKNKE